MNILASWNWLNELVDLKGLTPDAVAARVSLSGPGIEKLIPQGKDLDQVVVGRIQSIEPHEFRRVAVQAVINKKLGPVLQGSQNSSIRTPGRGISKFQAGCPFG